ncbi:hypothetical protein JCM5350_005679 [Sporobolomyces pararoseus]
MGPPPPRISRPYSDTYDTFKRLRSQLEYPISGTNSTKRETVDELLNEISKSDWNSMRKVMRARKNTRRTWTSHIILILDWSIRKNNHKALNRHQRAQAMNPTNLAIFHSRVDAVPESSNEEIKCLKRALRQLPQKLYARLYLEAVKNRNVIGAIIDGLKDLKQHLESANELEGSRQREKQNEREKLIADAEEITGEIGDLCIYNEAVDALKLSSNLKYIVPTKRISVSSRSLGVPSSFCPISRKSSSSLSSSF